MDENPYEAPKMLQKPSRSRFRWAIAVILVAILYVLSIGPFVAIEDGFAWQDWPEWAKLFYAPILWAVNQSRSADQFFDWYIGLWLPAGDPRRG